MVGSGSRDTSFFYCFTGEHNFFRPVAGFPMLYMCLWLNWVCSRDSGIVLRIRRGLACALTYALHWGAADAETEVQSCENTELKRSPFKDWSRSVYSHTCYAYCQEFLPRLFLPFQSIHMHFFPKTSPDFFLRWLWRNINRLKKRDLWYDDLWNESLGDRVKFAFSPDVILCGWLGPK